MSCVKKGSGYAITINDKQVELFFKYSKKLPPGSDGVAMKWGRDKAGNTKFRIYINPELKSLRDVVETSIHELLHCAYWHLDEEEIVDTAKDLTDFLIILLTTRFDVDLPV